MLWESNKMANEQNLIPNSERTPSELREITRKGGIASGKARREKRDFKHFAKIVLDEFVKDKKSGAELPTRYAALKSVLKKVLKEGDHNALKTLAQLAGELPKDGGNEVVINVNYNGVTKEAQDAIDEL